LRHPRALDSAVVVVDTLKEVKAPRRGGEVAEDFISTSENPCAAEAREPNRGRYNAVLYKAED
jgi:hypothetical protein